VTTDKDETTSNRQTCLLIRVDAPWGRKPVMAWQYYNLVMCLESVSVPRWN